MNLIIDIGNSFSKLEIWDNNILIKQRTTNVLTVDEVRFFLMDDDFLTKVNNSILCTVSQRPDFLIDFLKDCSNFIFFDHKTPIPIFNAYKTPETLGKDRLAAAVGAHFLFPKQNVLSIDIGTCIKYDFVSAESAYLGGAISPGMTMRFKSLNNFTDKLPLIEQKEINFFVGDTTENSILSGVINGMAIEINGMIEYYNRIYADLNVVLSGGDGKYFENMIKFRIFAIQNIVTLGLNVVLNHNKSDS
ncbi:MAG: type III pantothenate kinase [Bacteroidales bacterium]|nr:type III pantothenate kinase [Bacteroidales bacterium]